MNSLSTRKLIAYGASSVLLEAYKSSTFSTQFSFCVDRDPTNTTLSEYLPVVSPEDLTSKFSSGDLIVVTALATSSILAICEYLISLGYRRNEDFILWSEFSSEKFAERVQANLDWQLSTADLHYINAMSMASRLDSQTSQLGIWLVRGAIEATKSLNGSVAEVGVFQGGNAIIQLSLMNQSADTRNYRLIDSFAGFPDFSHEDNTVLQDNYSPEMYHESRLRSILKGFPNTSVHKGFVPEILQTLDETEKYSLIFYDCDLYQPAVDVLEYFWDKLVSGGILIFHDYISANDLWRGVKVAVDEFVEQNDVQLEYFLETTMCILIKP